MGRPREHDETTAAALLATAEQIVQTGGLDALSVRGVATATGTTTRAVYALFGSKDRLVVALGVRAFELLGQTVAEVPVTADPAADLVEAGLVFRRFAREHPALFAVGIRRDVPSRSLSDGFRDAASAALVTLHARVARLAAHGGLGGRSVAEAGWQFHALCEGLASIDLRDPCPDDVLEARWRGALSALVAGFAAAPVPHAMPAGLPT